MPYVFPTRLFNPPKMKWSIQGAALSGGRSLSGAVQNADLSGGGYWVAEFTDVPLWSREKIMAWRAVAAAASTGVRTIIVPVADRLHQPVVDPKLTSGDQFGLRVWEDDGPWLPSIGEVSAQLVDGVNIGDAQILVNGGPALIGGEHFSIQGAGGHRLYRVLRVISVDGGHQLLDVRPPMREAYFLSSILNFESPRSTMRLDGDMDLELDMLKRATASARFVEDFPPSLTVSSEGS